MNKPSAATRAEEITSLEFQIARLDREGRDVTPLTRIAVNLLRDGVTKYGHPAMTSALLASRNAHGVN